MDYRMHVEVWESLPSLHSVHPQQQRLGEQFVRRGFAICHPEEIYIHDGWSIGAGTSDEGFAVANEALVVVAALVCSSA